jgi:2',3'-cyclic-nucleotide 2'-phosphodiesterase/3'-nucleotidase
MDMLCLFFKKGDTMKNKGLFLALINALILMLLVSCAGGTEKKGEMYPLTDFSPVTRKASAVEEGKVVEINIFTTNDEHGWIFDWDFSSDSKRMSRGNPKPSGLARVSTLYKKLSTENPNSMLLSAGDSIQGTILSYYYNFIENDIVNPIPVLYQKMGYEAWTIGNHEVEQGNDVLLKVANEMEAAGIAVLGANDVWEDDNSKPYFKPYYIKEVEGVRIGVLGLVTPGIPMWLADETHEDHVYLDMVETAQKYVKILREVEKVDVLIGLFHSGMNASYDLAKSEAFGVPPANASMMVAQAIGSGPMGIDAIITGHSHQTIDDEQNSEFKDGTTNMVNGVKFVQAQNWGEKLGHMTVSVRGKKDMWTVDNVSVKTYSMANVEEDPEILDYMASYISGGKGYAAQVVGTATTDLLSNKSLFEETAIVDLIQDTQRYFSGAEISIAAAFNPDQIIAAGDITVGTVAGIYIYENFLNAVELTGYQIKDYLEFSSRFFNVITEENVDSVPLVNPEIRSYNYDMAQGFKYEIDITKEPGNRIINMMNLDGTAFDMDKTYNVTLNSYRYNGGGSHLAEAGVMDKGLLTTDTTYKSSDSMRDLMIEYLKVVGTWGPENIESNWKLVPEDLAARAVANQLGAGVTAR